LVHYPSQKNNKKEIKKERGKSEGKGKRETSFLQRVFLPLGTFHRLKRRKCEKEKEKERKEHAGERVYKLLIRISREKKEGTRKKKKEWKKRNRKRM
jgi:hypothetical protein